MDPAIEHRDLRPPPEPRLPWAVLLAIVVNVLLIAAVAWGIQATRDPASARPGPSTAAAISQRSASARPAATRTAANAAAQPAAQPRTACPLRPRLAAAVGGKDGQVFPPADVEGKTVKDIDALLVAGKEAAATGHVRDAEVDYLTSCRVADALKGAASIESADARYQLARHYVTAANAASAAPLAERTAIYEQAQAYYEDSLQRFRARLGDSHEKTRFAAQGLEAARVALAQTTQPAARPEVVTARQPAERTQVVTAPPLPGRPQAVAAPEPAARAEVAATTRMGAGPATPPAVQQQQPVAKLTRQVAPVRTAAPSVKPSFDCRRARSYAERTICSDAQLAQLDRDLGRLHARAKQAAPDPAAFRRQNDAEWHRREATCRDRACLLRWYADRRQQLTASLSQATLPPERTASR
ncbi:MAG: hypothetical protein JWP43_3334 [Ramlibacter sp.]|nr:hypothetical protein [Ramlibacter sp.]